MKGRSISTTYASMYEPQERETAFWKITPRKSASRRLNSQRRERGGFTELSALSVLTLRGGSMANSNAVSDKALRLPGTDPSRHFDKIATTADNSQKSKFVAPSSPALTNSRSVSCRSGLALLPWSRRTTGRRRAGRLVGPISGRLGYSVRRHRRRNQS
jgi:hypothetical protein